MEVYKIISGVVMLSALRLRYLRRGWAREKCLAFVGFIIHFLIVELIFEFPHRMTQDLAYFGHRLSCGHGTGSKNV